MKTTITGTQRIGRETETQTQTVDAAWEQTKAGVTVRWRENGQPSRLAVTNDAATLTRGKQTMEFLFHRRCPFSYDAGCGAMDLSTVTTAIRFSDKAVSLQYKLYADGALVSDNEVIIERI